MCLVSMRFSFYVRLMLLCMLEYVFCFMYGIIVCVVLLVSSMWLVC